jgi:hypothetical protein
MTRLFRHVTILALTALALALPARADSDDDAYLNALHKHGIENHAHGDAGLVKMGHMICDLLGQGYTMEGLADSGELHEGAGLSDDDVKFIIKTSAGAYCPEYVR